MHGQEVRGESLDSKCPGQGTRLPLAISRSTGIISPAARPAPVVPSRRSAPSARDPLRYTPRRHHIQPIKAPDATHSTSNLLTHDFNFDSTMSLFGSGMSSGNSHSNRNLPVVLAGGGFKHGEHKHYARQSGGASVELCNLYLSMLQNFGLDIDSFNRSTGPLQGLEMV